MRVRVHVCVHTSSSKAYDENRPREEKLQIAETMDTFAGLT